MGFGLICRVLLIVSLLPISLAHATGDPVRGQKKFYTCYGCHGIQGYKNAYPEYSVPKLFHQNAEYVISALHSYQSGERPHATMHAQAVSMSDQDIEDIAAYLRAGDPVKPNLQVYGATPKQAETCGACHGINGMGVDAPLEPKPPILAGQYADYLEQALTAYRKGRRKNAIMGAMAQALQSDEDVKVLARYFSEQASPLATPHPDEHR